MTSERVLASWGNCPIETTLAILGGKWKPLILYHLFDTVRRFGELQRLIPNVTREMLTQHLRELEADGIIHREIYQQVPPKVEYSLTELGETLRPILYAMHNWAVEYREHHPEIGGQPRLEESRLLVEEAAPDSGSSNLSARG